MQHLQHHIEALGFTVIKAPLRGDYPYCKRGRALLINEALPTNEQEVALIELWGRILRNQPCIAAEISDTRHGEAGGGT